MTTTTKAPASAAHKALAATAAAATQTGDALDAARARVVSTQQELADAEAAVLEAMTPGSGTKAKFEQARARVEKARSDIEWSAIEVQAAEAAHSRAADDAARAHRAVTAEEYVAEHGRHNDPASRENTLLTQLTETIAELIPLVTKRQQLHNRLAQELDHFPPDEREQVNVPQGRPITATSWRVGGWPVGDVPARDIADAINAGIDAAARQARAGD